MDQDKLLEDLVPDLLQPFAKAKARRTRFAHYTSAETAEKILRGKSVWLRNVGCMNDVDEVHSGIHAMVQNLGLRSKKGKVLWNALDSISDGISERTIKLFDDWVHDLTTNTYIVCLSEHLAREDKLGRLSMWRSYASPNGVALIINGIRLFQEDSPHGAFTVPMIYKSDKALAKMLGNFADRINANKAYIGSFDSEHIVAMILHFLKSFTLSIKHQAFSEEREWRVVYRPAENEINPPVINSKIVTLGGVPQKIYELPLENNPDRQMLGMDINELLDRIIVGPTEFPLQVRSALIGLLEEVGVEQPSEKVVISNIPLRL